MGLNCSSSLLSGYLFRIIREEGLLELSAYHDDVGISTEGWDVNSIEECEIPKEHRNSHVIVPGINYGLTKEQAYERHIDAVERFFIACVKHNMILNPKKCNLL